jgi:hypothetical protein
MLFSAFGAQLLLAFDLTHTAAHTYIRLAPAQPMMPPSRDVGQSRSDDLAIEVLAILADLVPLVIVDGDVNRCARQRSCEIERGMDDG